MLLFPSLRFEFESSCTIFFFFIYIYIYEREMKEDAPDMLNNSSTDLKLKSVSKTRLT
jgi:hypothetical protein